LAENGPLSLMSSGCYWRIFNDPEPVTAAIILTKNPIAEGSTIAGEKIPIFESTHNKERNILSYDEL
jgi:hypothetical protein